MLTSLFAGMSILLIGDSHLAAPGYLITTCLLYTSRCV